MPSSNGSTITLRTSGGAAHTDPLWHEGKAPAEAEDERIRFPVLTTSLRGSGASWKRRPPAAVLLATQKRRTKNRP